MIMETLNALKNNAQARSIRLIDTLDFDLAIIGVRKCMMYITLNVSLHGVLATQHKVEHTSVLTDQHKDGCNPRS